MSIVGDGHPVFYQPDDCLQVLVLLFWVTLPLDENSLSAVASAQHTGSIWDAPVSKRTLERGVRCIVVSYLSFGVVKMKL